MLLKNFFYEKGFLSIFVKFVKAFSESFDLKVQTYVPIGKIYQKSSNNLEILAIHINLQYSPIE